MRTRILMCVPFEITSFFGVGVPARAFCHDRKTFYQNSWYQTGFTLVLLIFTFLAFGCGGGSDEDESFLRDENVIEVPSGEISFGVEIVNGEVRPWAEGPEPIRQTGNLIRDIDPPFGTLGLTWTGRFTGYTDDLEYITGNVRLHVSFDTPLEPNRLEITNIMSDTVTDAGIRRIVEKLSYNLYFVDNKLTDGEWYMPPKWQEHFDEQENISGQFFGLNYEGVGGTLNFNYLIGAFGAKRKSN